MGNFGVLLWHQRVAGRQVAPEARSVVRWICAAGAASVRALAILARFACGASPMHTQRQHPTDEQSRGTETHDRLLSERIARAASAHLAQITPDIDRLIDEIEELELQLAAAQEGQRDQEQ